jgi:hypothetical protein
MLLLFLRRQFKNRYQLLSSNNFIVLSENKYLLNKNITGNDERNEKNMTIVNIKTNNEMEKMILLYNKKCILDMLQNDKISTNTKLDIITTNLNSIKPSSLKAGGLMKDSDFDF